MALDEFEIISRYFQKIISRKDVITAVGDDCAVLRPLQAHDLLISTDTLNEGIHFFKETDPFDIGYKSVAVSLSDLSAMGGDPAWLLLSLTLHQSDPEWLADFSKGLFECCDRYNLALIGGNITKGPLSITTQICGYVAENKALLRKGAKAGDLIYVTGSLGDSALALALLQDKLDSTLFSKEEQNKLINRLWRPNPRITAGKLLVGVATAAIDISDGLLADLGHILKSSGVGARLFLNKLPISTSMKKLDVSLSHRLSLTVGDDYELCFTVSPERESELIKIADQCHTLFTQIGVIESTPGLKLYGSMDKEINLESKGYKHF